MVGLLPLRPTTPEAADEAKAQDALLANALAYLTRDMHFEVLHPALQAPTGPEQAPSLVRGTKVDALVWGDVSLESGKLAVKLAGFEKTVDAPFSTWPMEYSLAETQGRELRELDALRTAQFLLEISLLPQMMRNRPAEVRRTLEALSPRHPQDWASLNRDIVERRWGMLGRLTRDGALTEKGYRGALDEVLAYRAKSSEPPSQGNLFKEAFYSVGLARGFLLQNRPQDAVDVLSDVVRRMPELDEPRLVLGRAWLALGNKEQATEVLEPLMRKNPGAVATRLYVAAVEGQPERVSAALTQLVEQSPQDATARLLRYLLAPDSEAMADLKVLIASQPSGDWPMPVARYLLGEVDEQALWAATKDADDHMERIRRCQAHYFLDEAALAGILPGRAGAPDKAEARRHFEAVLTTRAFHQPTYDMADAQVEQLRLSEGR